MGYTEINFKVVFKNHQTTHTHTNTIVFNLKSPDKSETFFYPKDFIYSLLERGEGRKKE